MSNVREIIIDEFSRWVVLSSVRSGCPVKSRKDVNRLLASLDYATLKNGRKIGITEFNDWHRKTTKSMQKMSEEELKKPLPLGWAVKMINMYLKSRVYIAQEKVRPGLMSVIHPPIDSYLWEGIKNRYRKDSEIISKTHLVEKIQDIDDYENKYMEIIKGLKMVAKSESCLLIEVEQFWQPT